MGEWKIVCEPQGENPGKLDQAVGAAARAAGKDTVRGTNTGGLVVYVVEDGSGQRHEVSRVGFVRRNTKNPKVAFEKQLQKELDTAKETVAALNTALTPKDGLQ